ncbi:helix-turn-helix transcriptional regulator [Novosphingobium profundi]|nr:helix-turn-helix transcriptional regulator [Novosphingobium profundi]MBT0670379.1 helix-turn-helix transcriptional regulator [Novosphingobium profundi]
MNWLNDAPEDFQAESSRIEIYRPDVNYRIAALRAPMEITWEAHYDVARKAHTDEAYLELARKYGFEHGAQVVLAQKPGLFFGLALMRSPSEGRTGTSEHETLARIAPDILSAIRVQESIEQAGASLLHGALETMETAAILLDSLGRVTHVTPAAQRLLGPETLQLNGRAVRSNRPYIDRALGIRIGQALSGDDPGPADLWIRTGSGLLLVDVRPLPRGNWHLGTNGAAIVTLRPLLTPRVRAEDVADEKNFAIMAGKLATALALTHSEAEVTTLLAHGLSRKEIAALRHVSPQTVNTQLRMIFLKCEVNRESELVAIARSILDAIGS